MNVHFVTLSNNQSQLTYPDHMMESANQSTSFMSVHFVNNLDMIAVAFVQVYF